MQHLEGSGTPVLYIGQRFLKVNGILLLMVFFCLLTGLPDVHFPWHISTQMSLSGHPSYMLKPL